MIFQEEVQSKTPEEKLNDKSNMQKLLEWKFSRRKVKLCKVCWACGALPKYSKMTVHHILPIGEGGLDLPQNRIRLCEECHKKIHLKQNLSENQWNLRLIKLRILNDFNEDFKKEKS